MAWAKEEAAKDTAEYNAKKEKVSIDFSQTYRIPLDEERSFHAGYLFLQQLCSELRLDNICRNIRNHRKITYDLHAVLTDLIYARILSPSTRTEVKYETYAKEINVEARAMIDIAAKQIIPAVIKYAKHLADAIISIQTIPGMDVSVETELLKETTKLLRESQTALKILQEKTEAASLIENNERQARYYHDEVNTAMEALRKPIDQLEMIVDKEMWPMPSYGDLMFEV